MVLIAFGQIGNWYADCFTPYRGVDSGAKGGSDAKPPQFSVHACRRHRGQRATAPGARRGHDSDQGRHPQADPRHHAVFLREIRPGRLQDRGDPLRDAARRQERGGDQIGRLRNLWHCRRHAGRRGGRAGGDHRRGMQQGHGDRGRRQVGHQDAEGPEGQEGRDLAGLDPGSGDAQPPGNGKDDHQRHRAGARAVLGNGDDPGARRCGCLRRRRAGAFDQPGQGRRQDFGIPLHHADRQHSTW